MKYKKKLIKYDRYIQLDKNKFIKCIIIIIVLIIFISKFVYIICIVDLNFLYLKFKYLIFFLLKSY